MDNNYISMKRASEILCVSYSAVAKMIETGDIKGRKMNPKVKRSKYLIPMSEIERKRKEWE